MKTKCTRGNCVSGGAALAWCLSGCSWSHRASQNSWAWWKIGPQTTQCDFSPNSLLLGLSMCINSFLRGVRLFPGGVRLSGCLPIHLSPSLAGGARLSGFLSLNLHVSLHLLPTLSSGVRLSGRLFFAFTCLSSCVSRNVFPKLFVSQFSCLLSGGVWLFRLCTFACLPSFVSHHLSSTWSVSDEFVSDHVYSLVGVSCSSFITISFVFRVVSVL